MSRVPKWRIEKTKVKVVFRLQFHATNIPPTGWEKLFLSFISADTGKATAKTNKANVRNGSCKWPDPIYEATQLLQDSRTKKYDKKFYKLVMAMGSSRSSILGEVDVNLAEFVEALRPASVALPLCGCDFGTILHVTVQLLTTKTGFREFEQQRETGVRSSQMLVNQRSHDPSEFGATSSDIGDDKVDARVRIKENFLLPPSAGEAAESTEDYENLSPTSDGLFFERNDLSGGHEISSFKSTISGDLTPFSTSQSPALEKEKLHGNHFPIQGSNDWTHGWSLDYSADNYIAAAHEENNRLRVRLEVAESAFSQLKSEAKSLQRITDVLGTETHDLAQHLAVELASGHQLTSEVSLLRTECSDLKRDLKEVISSRLLQQAADRDASGLTTAGLRNTLSKHGSDDNITDPPVNDVQTKWLQSLVFLESKLQQTRKNVCHGLQGSNLDFVLADLEVLLHVLENLKQGIQIGESHYLELVVEPSSVAYRPSPGHDSEFLKKNSSNTGMMEEKMCELLQKLEDSKTDKENLLAKMSQMERYYEAFIHKLEESQKQTLKELENLRNEHTSCFYTVSVLQAQKQKMHEEMNEQLIRFVEDRKALESQNKELERRAVTSETVLKRVRWNYSAAVDRLQKDLELLSLQVLSMYESNETLAKQTFETYDNYAEGLLCGVEVHGQYKPDVKQTELKSLCATTESEVISAENNTSYNFSHNMGGQRSLLVLNNEEIHKRSASQMLSNADAQVNHSNLKGLKGICSTMEAELLEMYAASIEWKVFSDVLCESHHNMIDQIKCLQERTHELENQLHDSNGAQESLVIKLNSLLDEAKSLRESEARYISKNDDLMVKNQILEAKLHDISVENAFFMEKIAEFGRLVEEYKACESKYTDCVEERKRFEDLLMQESVQTCQLKNEIRSVMEDFKALKEELDKQTSLNNDVQRVLAYLRERLGDLCSKIISCIKEINISGFDEASPVDEFQGMNYTAAITTLELFQQHACQKILQLQQEKEAAEGLNDILRINSEKCESELVDMKQKFQSDMDAATGKLNLSGEHVEKLQQELQDMAQKFEISSESQEKCSVTNSNLVSRMGLLEVQLQHLASENKALAQKLEESAAVVEELERTKVSLADCEEDNSTFMMSIQAKSELLMQKEDEVRGLQGGLRFTEENLLREKGLREQLESVIKSLTSQLHEKDQLLHSLDEHKAELNHLRDQVLDLEKANHSMQDAFLQGEEFQKELNVKNSSIHSQLSKVEDHLLAALEARLAAEIEANYMRFQVREVVVQNNLFRKDIEELELKHEGADVLSRVHMSSEAELDDRNATLEAAIHSLNLEKVIQEKESLEELIKRKAALAEVTKSESKIATVWNDNNMIIHKYQDEILQLKVLLTSLEKQIDDLRSTKDEFEILNMILLSKLEEQHTQMSLLQECGQELTNLKEQHRELTQKLAEQILKTEEFKNLSIQLRELKEKAQTGTKENDRSLYAMQESLRVAFIKEHNEPKVQELKGQVFVSKKYAEEMLLKLQNALDEVEIRRKNEIALAKRIEDLSMKVSEMEVELRDVSTDKRELANAYASLNTEQECLTLSYNCCKEEKQKIEASFQECSEERGRIRMELDLLKRLMGNISLADNIESCYGHGSCTSDTTSIGQILKDIKFRSAPKVTMNITEVNSRKQEDQDSPESTSFSLNLAQEGEGVEKCSEHGYVNSILGSEDSENYHKECEASLENQSSNNSVKERSKEHTKLAIDLNLFQKELERLKNENVSSLLPLDINLADPSFNNLERALSQLDMANDHLQSMFPPFKELSGSGNALERVLALELELAKAFQAKKTDILFQGSFLKQHNDEAAVFQSFRDINELIQDMIELKRRQVAVESELKEMQGRYSELSVQFAEVEGERQKLVMTLKNRKNRSPRKS